MIEMFGAFSRLAADDEGEESLYAVHDTQLAAFIALAKIVIHRAFFLIPHENFHTLTGGLIKIADTENWDKAINVAGLLYYIRPMTQEELEEINQKEE